MPNPQSHNTSKIEAVGDVAPSPRYGWKRIVQRCTLVVVAALIGIELFSRFVLGLGTPPLILAHPRIEYMMKPNQDVYRFGNHVQTNAWGMRSPAFPARKLDPNELRILVFGDSVINGGALTNQSELATSLVQHELEKRLGRPVVVGNVSAGSWGPGNWRAFVEEFGFFDADYIILVANSGDVGDCPTFARLDPIENPSENPTFATYELVMRYLPRYLPTFSSGGSAASAVPANPSHQHSAPTPIERIGLEDLRKFLSMAKSQTANVALVHFLDRSEVESGTESPSFTYVEALCNELHVPAFSTRVNFPSDHAAEYFRDPIHPNLAGQKKLYEALMGGPLDSLTGETAPNSQPNR
jgi:hypothetical protein